jgi:hypothetical protein
MFPREVPYIGDFAFLTIYLVTRLGQSFGTKRIYGCQPPPNA